MLGLGLLVGALVAYVVGCEAKVWAWKWEAAHAEVVAL
jgi:hypothetical protein